MSILILLMLSMIIKINFFAEQISFQFNEGIDSSKYAESFKFTNITSAFKQSSRNLKDKFRFFEKLMCKQLSNYFDNIFSKFQCGFRKGFNAQHSLLFMIDK